MKHSISSDNVKCLQILSAKLIKNAVASKFRNGNFI